MSLSSIAKVCFVNAKYENSWTIYLRQNIKHLMMPMDEIKSNTENLERVAFIIRRIKGFIALHNHIVLNGSCEIGLLKV